MLNTSDIASKVFIIIFPNNSSSSVPSTLENFRAKRVIFHIFVVAEFPKSMFSSFLPLSFVPFSIMVIVVALSMSLSFQKKPFISISFVFIRTKVLDSFSFLLIIFPIALICCTTFININTEPISFPIFPIPTIATSIFIKFSA